MEKWTSFLTAFLFSPFSVLLKLTHAEEIAVDSQLQSVAWSKTVGQENQGARQTQAEELHAGNDKATPVKRADRIEMIRSESEDAGEEEGSVSDLCAILSRSPTSGETQQAVPACENTSSAAAHVSPNAQADQRPYANMPFDNGSELPHADEDTTGSTDEETRTAIASDEPEESPAVVPAEPTVPGQTDREEDNGLAQSALKAESLEDWSQDSSGDDDLTYSWLRASKSCPAFANRTTDIFAVPEEEEDGLDEPTSEDVSRNDQPAYDIDPGSEDDKNIEANSDTTEVEEGSDLLSNPGPGSEDVDRMIEADLNTTEVEEDSAIVSNASPESSGDEEDEEDEEPPSVEDTGAIAQSNSPAIVTRNRIIIEDKIPLLPAVQEQLASGSIGNV